MIKEAIILAAGRGSRFKDRTKVMPKGFIEFDGIPIVEKSIRFLLNAGIEKIIIGTGHGCEYYEQLTEKIPQIITVYNPDYANCGSMGTLEVCAPYAAGGVLLLESDLLYERRALSLLLENPLENIILASGKTNSGDEVYLDVDEQHNIRKISKNADELSAVFAELVGITKLSGDALAYMCDYAQKARSSNPRMEYETALYSIRDRQLISVLKEEGLIWCEIDDEQHLKRAQEIIYPKLAVSKNYFM